MKTVILVILLTLTALQAEDTVYYDKKEVKSSSMSKPYYLSSDLYLK